MRRGGWGGRLCGVAKRGQRRERSREKREEGWCIIRGGGLLVWVVWVV